MWTKIELFFPGFHPGQHQQIFCKASHAVRIAPDDLQKFPRAVIEQTIRFDQCFRVAADRGQRRTQFMRHIGDKVTSRFFYALNFRNIMQYANHAPSGRGSALMENDLRPERDAATVLSLRFDLRVAVMVARKSGWRSSSITGAP